MPISATPEILFSAEHTYRVLNQLAESTNSTVYLAAVIPMNTSIHGEKPHPSDEQLVVLKKLPRTYAACYELEVHQRVHAHPNILPLLDVVVTEDAIYLVLEYCPAGDLFDAILAVHGDTTLTQYQRERWALQTFRELVLAVQWCHQLGVWHRDIKPENILLASNGRVQLTDFGLATEHAQTEERGKGSLFYMAPELFAGPNEPYGSQPVDSTRADVWALGVLLLNMLGGRNPWPRAAYDDEAFQIYLGCTDELRIAFNLSNDAWLVLERMLSVDPQYRPSIESVLTWIELVENWIVPKVATSVTAPVPPVTNEEPPMTEVCLYPYHSHPSSDGERYNGDEALYEERGGDKEDEENAFYAAAEAEIAEMMIQDDLTVSGPTTTPVTVTRSASLGSLNEETRSHPIAEPTMIRSVSQASTPSYTFSEYSASETDEEEDATAATSTTVPTGDRAAPKSSSTYVATIPAIQLPTRPARVYQSQHLHHTTDHLAYNIGHPYQGIISNQSMYQSNGYDHGYGCVCDLDYTVGKAIGNDPLAILEVKLNK